MPMKIPNTGKNIQCFEINVSLTSLCSLKVRSGLRVNMKSDFNPDKVQKPVFGLSMDNQKDIFVFT